MKPIEISYRPPFTVEVTVTVRYRASGESYYNGETVALASLTSEADTLDIEALPESGLRGVGGLIATAFTTGARNVRAMEINAAIAKADSEREGIAE